MLVDSHAHLVHKGMESPLDPLLARAQAAGIQRIINISTNLEELEAALLLKQSYPWIDHACAITPHDVAQLGETQFDAIAVHARQGHLIALGETGLDYHYMHAPKQLQQEFLERYFELAKECSLPVIIHCREAFADFFSILDQASVTQGVLHCFTGTLEDAHAVIERGWMLSLSGIVTFKNSVGLQEIAKWVPLESLLIETDAPYLAPHPYRGRSNEPAYLVHTAQYLAHLKGISFQELAQATAENAARLFRKTAS